MATWEDGPEYAPVQRPEQFTAAVAAPLEQAPPAVNLAAGLPPTRPRFDQPTAPVADLADLIPPVPDQRDPQQAFDVVTSSVTDSTSVWGSVHWTAPAEAAAWPAPPADPYAAAPPASPWPDPAAAAWPTQPAPTGAYGGYPAPGTTGWFAPPPPAYAPAPTAGLTPRAVLQAVTPGVIICLLVAGLIYPLAPVAILVGLVLTSRVRVARRAVQLIVGLLVAILVLAALVGLARMAIDLLLPSEVWTMVSRWGQVCAWPTLVGVVLVVARALRGQGAPPRPTTWA